MTVDDDDDENDDDDDDDDSFERDGTWRAWKYGNKEEEEVL